MRKIILLIILVALGLYAYNNVDFEELIPQTNDSIRKTDTINMVNTRRDNRKNELNQLGY